MAFGGLGSLGSIAASPAGNMGAAMAAANGVMAEHPSAMGPLHKGVSNDNDPQKEELQNLVQSESKGQDIPRHLSDNAKALVATGATLQELEKIAAVLQAVEMRGGPDAAHSPAPQHTPNAPKKGGMELGFA